MEKEIRLWDVFDHIEHGAMMVESKDGYYVTHHDHLSALSDLERKHAQQLTDCRKKCEDFGRKMNELAHENKRLRGLERKHREEMEGMYEKIQGRLIPWSAGYFAVRDVFAAHGITPKS